jgi:hypothetical protein
MKGKILFTGCVYLSAKITNRKDGSQMAQARFQEKCAIFFTSCLRNLFE